MSLLLKDRIYSMESPTAKRGVYPLHGYKLGLYRIPIKLDDPTEMKSIFEGLKKTFEMDMYADRIYATYRWQEENMEDPDANGYENVDLSITVEIVTGEVVDIIYQIFSLEKFIYSLGIRHIGQENAKLLARHLKSSDSFFKLPKNENMSDLVNIDGIGETQINSIKNFFVNETNLEVLFELQKILKIDNVFQINKNGSLKNKTFMFTGKLNGMSRAEAKSLIEQNSGKIISNVNKKLDYLVIGEKPTTKKVNNAKDLNVKVITQDEWMKMLNKTG